MRLVIEMQTKAEFAYDSSYHTKLRGRLWRALKGTDYEDKHDDAQPLGWSFSNPFPPRHTIPEGETMWLVVSARERDLIGHVAENLTQYPDIDIGQMQFSVEDMSLENPNVGKPGTGGTIKTETGVLVRLDEDECEEYGIEYGGEQGSGNYTYWNSEHPLDAFVDHIESNLSYKHRLFDGKQLNAPDDVEYPLFNGVNLVDTHAVPVKLGNGHGHTQTFRVSSWEFDYNVVDADHRRHLNLLLDTGVGEGNGLGFGFCNVQKTGGYV